MEKLFEGVVVNPNQIIEGGRSVKVNTLKPRLITYITWTGIEIRVGINN